MLRPDEYKKLDATDLSELVKKKEVTPLELLEIALKLSQEETYNAVIHLMRDSAQKQIKEFKENTGRFHGVPFLLKDLLQAYAGEPMACGSKALRDYRPMSDSDLVKKFKNSGLVIFGKTNTPEFGLMGVTEPEFFGVTQNPWKTHHTAGGSSGGSAAAVAAGLAPMAGAGDGGGSIRIPAACCGLVGLKATRGRFPSGPDGEVWDGAVVEGVLSRTVRDSAYALEEFQGASLNAPYVLSNIVLADALERAPEKKFKIMLVDENPFTDFGIDNEVKVQLHLAAKKLESLGHTVIQRPLKVDAMQAAKSYLIMYFGQVAQHLEDVKMMAGKDRQKDVELTTKLLASLGRTISACEYVAAKKYWSTLSTDLNREFQEVDLILTPTLATEPLEHHCFDPSDAEMVIIQILLSLRATKLLLKTGIVEQLARDSLSKLPFTFLTNLTGNPSISVPGGLTTKGLPTGLHFIAPHGAEIELLQIAKILEGDQGFPTVF